jgi:hypothetical protein
MPRRSLRAGTLLLMALLLAPSLVQAQGLNATINGSVLDPSGAAVPNVELTLTHVTTGVTAKTTSGSDGLYSFPNLVPGEYELKASAPGFRDFVQRGIKVNINTIARVDARLELGTAVQTVEVSANASPLNFENAVRQEGITPETLQELPLIVSERPRSAASFAILMPGVTTGGQANPFDSRINGGLQSGDEAIVDGVSMQQGLMSQTGMISIFQDFGYSPDMVSEIKILTANYEPQYGSSTSSQIIAITKSGTNEFHGNAYAFERNTVLNARQFGALNKTDSNGNEISGTARPKNLQHDLGASIGGPIKIKPFWGGRKKAYFYVNFEAFRQAGGATAPTITVPTAKMKNGDFSEWTDENTGALIPIYDPATTVLDGSGNVVSRQQFMGCDGLHPNVICMSDINPATGQPYSQSLAMKWLGFLPDPNLPGVRNNYRVPTAIPDVLLGHTNDWLVKIDANWRDADHFSASVRYQGAAALFNSRLPRPISEEVFTAPQYSFVDRFNWDHTFSPTLLNNFNFGYLDRNEGYGSIDITAAESSSLMGLIPGVASSDFPPRLDFGDGYQSMGNNSGFNTKNRTERPSYIANDLLTWVRGKHTFKFGGEHRRLGENNRTNVNESGTFYFDPNQTGLPGTVSGNAMASFLLEQVSSGNVDYRTASSWYPRANAIIFHFGDTWKVTPKLSLNLGVRWDRFTPSSEKYNRSTFFDPTGANPAAGGRLGRLAIAGSGWGPASFGRRHPEETWNKGFAPRVGIAYAWSNKTVIRTGYGIFYTQAFYPGWGGGISTLGFDSNVSRSSPDGAGYRPAFILREGFNVQPNELPPFLDPGARNGQGLNYRPFDANRLSNAQQWNLTIEHQFTTDFYISTAYVGNKGTRLPSSTAPVNALNPALLNAMGAQLFDTFTDDTSVDGVAAPYTGWAEQLSNVGCAPTVGQALLPYPQFCDQLRGLNENAGNSTYHSFQFKAEKRFSRGTFLLASYTISKLLTSSDHVDQPAGAGDWSGAHGVISPFERQRNKALAYDDVPQVLSIAFVYDLPFGSGRRWASQKGVVDKIVGGWQLSGTFRISSGIPIFFRNFDTCDIPGGFRVGCIPAIIGDPWAQDKSNFDPNKPLFNKDAFELTGRLPGPDGILGNADDTFNYGHGPRITNLRGFGYHNQDFALLKEIPITERVKFSLRIESFNIWNWHIFNRSGEWGDQPFNVNVTSGNFGFWNGGDNVTAPRVFQLGGRISF